MAQDQVEEIKQKTDIVELISEYVDLKRSGRNFKALCPFHSEKTPSFMVSPEIQIFKCFGCGRGGDCYTFLQEYEKIEFPEALKMLADRAGIKLKPLRGFRGFEVKEELYKANYLSSEFYHYLLIRHAVGKEALTYLHGRGIKQEAIEVFKLGYAPNTPQSLFSFLKKRKGYKEDILEKAGLTIKRQGGSFDRFRDRIIFPLHDHLGNVAGFAGRVIPRRGAKEGSVAKYINTPDTLIYKKGKLLYGLNMTKQDIKDEEIAIVVEGELDCVSSWQTGVRNVVAIKGSALTEDQASLLSRFCQEVRLAVDSDIAGDEAARRAISQLVSRGLAVKVVGLGKFKDPDEAAQKNPGFWKKTIEAAQEVYDFLIDRAFEKYDARQTEGKAKISRFLSPVLASIEDDIVRAHCVRKVAQRLEVSESAVFSQLGKSRPQSMEKSNLAEAPVAQNKKPDKTRRELLEEYLLTLFFQLQPEALRDGKNRKLFNMPACQRIVSEWYELTGGKRDLDPSEFADRLSAQLVPLFAHFILIDLPERFENPGEISKEIEGVKRELRILTLKEEMAQLVERIRESENKGKTKEVEKFEGQFARAGEKLATLEAN